MNFTLQHNPILTNQLSQLEEQFYWHADFHKEKFEITKYMMYFQSYSNTYAPFETLQALYDKALSFKNVIGLSIGTRTDCMNDKILDLLASYVKNGSEIWLEYGVQSVYDQTLKSINRGHSTQGMQELFAKTRQKGIKVCAHLIYGLPNETNDMMLHSLDSVIKWGVDGLKIHPLYVVEDTQLARMYKAQKYDPSDLESYIDLIVESIKIIPEDVVIQRISSGAHDETLLAPKWCFDKNIQMRALREKLLEIGVIY